MGVGRDNRLESKWVKKKVVHWLVGKGDGISLVSRKSSLVKKRQ